MLLSLYMLPFFRERLVQDWLRELLVSIGTETEGAGLVSLAMAACRVSLDEWVRRTWLATPGAFFCKSE